MNEEKKVKNRWDMSQEERDKQDNKTTIITFFVVLPLILAGFLVVGAAAEYIWNNLGYESVLNIGKLTILGIVALVVFGIGFKVAKKLGIDK